MIGLLSALRVRLRGYLVHVGRRWRLPSEGRVFGRIVLVIGNQAILPGLVQFVNSTNDRKVSAAAQGGGLGLSVLVFREQALLLEPLQAPELVRNSLLDNHCFRNCWRGLTSGVICHTCRRLRRERLYSCEKKMKCLTFYFFGATFSGE